MKYQNVMGHFIIPKIFPSFSIIFLVALLLVNVFHILNGAVVSGVSWDEPGHVRWLSQFFKNGWYVWGPDDLRGYTYGPIPSLGGHLTNVLLGFEVFGQPTAEIRPYIGRHLFVAMLSTLGIIATGFLGYLATNRKMCGLLAATILSAIPLWAGHSMFNHKDIPSAVGYTFVTLGLVLLHRGGVARKWGSLPIFFGVFLSMGTRPALWTVILLSAVVAAVVYITTNRSQPAKNVTSQLSISALVFFASGALAYSLLQFIYPKMFAPAWTMALNSLASSSSYSWSNDFLSAGIVHNQPPPSWYLPTWFLAQTPVMIAMMALLAIVIAIKYYFSRTILAKPISGMEFTGIMVASQALALPLAAILLSSVIYDGLRQMSFMLPAVAVSSVIGVNFLRRKLTLATQILASRVLITGFVVFGALIPSLEQIRLHPYQYTYYSELGRVVGVDNVWPTDYWKVGLRELATKVPSGGKITCGHETCGDPSLTPFIEQKTSPNESESHYFNLRYNRFGVDVSEGCEVHDQIERDLWPQIMTIGWVERCPVGLKDQQN